MEGGRVRRRQKEGRKVKEKERGWEALRFPFTSVYSHTCTL